MSLYKIIEKTAEIKGTNSTFSSFEFYPNPSKGNVNIVFNERQVNAHFVITSIDGKQIETINLPQNSTKFSVNLYYPNKVIFL